MLFELQNRVLNYWGLNIGEAASIYQQYGIPETITALEYGFHQADNLEKLGCVCCFLRDSLNGNAHDCPAFREAANASNIAAIMEKLLLDGPQWMRFTLVYTMKVGLTGHKPLFWEAFDKFRDTDPLLMPTLLGEAGWTRAVEGDEMSWLLLESPVYLSRWALANCKPELPFLEKMQADPHPRIQQEAIYQIALRHWYETHKEFSRAENKQRRKEIEAKKPVTFDDLSLRFSHFRHSLENDNLEMSCVYTVEELAAFDQTLS